jgi:hypothetical protein
MISADENAALLSAQRLLAAVHGRAVHGSAVLSFVIPRACDFFDLFVFFADDPMFLIPTTESSS